MTVKESIPEPDGLLVQIVSILLLKILPNGILDQGYRAGLRRNSIDVPGITSYLCRVCEHYFGKARQFGSSHRMYKTPWQGDPRVNIQNSKEKAKAYQVKQVIKAIERLEVESDTTK